MVTDDELANIIRLRGRGRTHQEIADELKLTRQTVAYQLSKLKNTANLEKPVRIIKSSLQNSGNLAIIRLSIDLFEELRENELIYADRAELFEMRGNCIHSCGWPPNRTNQTNPNQWFVDNYGTLAPYIPTMLEQNPHGVMNWVQDVPNQVKVYRDSVKFSGASVRHQHSRFAPPKQRGLHPQIEAMLQEKRSEVSAVRKSAEKLPTSTVECAMLLLNGDFPTPPSEAQFNEHTYSKGPIYDDLAKKLCLELHEVHEWLQHPASHDLTISRQEFLDSGASGPNEFYGMKGLGFENAESYRTFQSICRAIEIKGGKLKSRGIKNHDGRKFISFDERDKAIARFVRCGWTDSSDIENAFALGLDPEEGASYREMIVQVQSWGFGDAPLPALMWLCKNGMSDQRYQGFDAPRSAALYHLIAESNSSRFLLNALVEQYNAFAEPGTDLDKSQLCGLLSSAPFDALVVATMESGLVEKLGEQTEVREVIREVEVEVVKEVEVIKEVEQLSSMNALFAFSSYKHFTELLQNDGFQPIREAAEMLSNAINRGEHKTSYKEAWAVFGAVAREIVDSEKEGDFNKKLIEVVGDEFGLSKSDMNDLHKLRMIRNDIDKVKAEGGSNQRPTTKHLQRCMAVIDRLIHRMLMTTKRPEFYDGDGVCPSCRKDWEESHEYCDWCGWSEDHQ